MPIAVSILGPIRLTSAVDMVIAVRFRIGLLESCRSLLREQMIKSPHEIGINDHGISKNGLPRLEQYTRSFSS